MARDTKFYTDKYLKDLIKGIDKSCLELGNIVEVGTPVDTGRARASWERKFNNMGAHFTFLSHLSYIKSLEDGHSDQAKDGMVKINTPLWESLLVKNLK